MQDWEDDRLLSEYGRGRQAAFTVLVDRYGERLKSYALRMLRSPEQAEEVYVETFLRVATGAARFEKRGTVRGWLFTIAHRQCLDVLRHRRVEREAAPTLLAMADARPVTPSPEAVCQLGQQAAALEAALQSLPEEHRQVVLLRLVHDLSAAEVGTVLGLTESQVHSQLSYARKRLRDLLAEESRPAAARRRP